MKFKKIIKLLICVSVAGAVLTGCSDPAEKKEQQTGFPADRTARPTPDSTEQAPETPAATAVPLPSEYKSENYWTGKTLAFLGDSITEMAGYQGRVKRLLGAKKIDTYAVGGTTISGRNQSFTVRAPEIEADADLIFVLGGTNDFHINTPIGAITDQANTETFYGAVRLLCEILTEQHPDAVIVFATPLQRTNPADQGVDGKNRQGLKLSAYADAIIHVCAEFEIPVLDFYNTSAITEETSQQYLFDGLHPNTDGFIVMAKEIAAYLSPAEK